MKKLALIAKTSLSVALMAATLSSCSGSSDSAAGSTDSTGTAQTTPAGTPTSINIRYIDGDSISAKYDLAKEFQEQYLRSLSKMQQAEQGKTAELQRFGSQIEEKMRSNGYLSEDSYNADMSKFSKMQQDAQLSLANLQRSTEQELVRQQQVLNDSIESFIKEYNATHGYDAILYKAAGVYFNPALDITDEVVAGLNARYNKGKGEKK